MCQTKSGIILKDRVFLPDYDSHGRMLEELKIADTRENAEQQFADRLKQLREIRGITQDQLAEAIGVTRQSLSRYEYGERTPNAIVLHDIAVYFDVTLDYLLGLSGAQSEHEEIYTAHRYTGLSAKTVIALHNAKNDETKGGIRRMEAIKCLLEDFD